MARTSCDTLYKSEWTENSRNTTQQKSPSHEGRRVWHQDSCPETNQVIFGSNVDPIQARILHDPNFLPVFLPKTWDKGAQQSLTEPFSPQPLLSASSALTQLFPQQLLSCLCQPPFIK